ncbi:hydrophobin [Xylariales sp. AK1849]|nr:hydrophobin [Xylariales sp. AK1849]
MQLITLLLPFLATAVLATPSFNRRNDTGGGGGSSYVACTSLLYGTAQCCSTDVLGVADLDCANPATAPKDVADFVATCAGVGQKARCCVLPVADQDVLCETPLGA